jgi:uncharacterized protein
MTSPSPAIADTSVLSALCRIGRLEILHLRFPLVIVPQAVHMEIEAASALDIPHMIDAACAAGWMRISDTPTEDWQPPISRLGPGETAALALATGTPGAILLMDERRGRRAARMLGLPVTGVLGLLMWARQSGHLDSLSQAILDLRAKDGFFIDQDLLSQACEAVGEVWTNPP